MLKIRNVGFVIALLSLFAVNVSATPQTTPAPAPTPAPTATPAPKSTHAKRTHHTLSGAIDTYDPTAHTLTLKTTKSSVVFQVAAAKVWVGAKSVSLDDIAAQKGAQATVSYALKAGEKKASTVRIAEAKTK